MTSIMIMLNFFTSITITNYKLTISTTIITILTSKAFHRILCVEPERDRDVATCVIEIVRRHAKPAWLDPDRRPRQLVVSHTAITDSLPGAFGIHRSLDATNERTEGKQEYWRHLLKSRNRKKVEIEEEHAPISCTTDWTSPRNLPHSILLHQDGDERRWRQASGRHASSTHVKGVRSQQWDTWHQRGRVARIMASATVVVLHIPKGI
jgi:hypothetical protein